MLPVSIFSKLKVVFNYLLCAIDSMKSGRAMFERSQQILVTRLLQKYGSTAPEIKQNKLEEFKRLGVCVSCSIRRDPKITTKY
jgi:uncharacterized protein YlxP (DUF503 family)